jgi:hypothetical protein
MTEDIRKLSEKFVGKKLVALRLSENDSYLQLYFEGSDDHMVVYPQWLPHDQTWLEIDFDTDL